EPSAVVTATPRSNVTTPVLSLHFDGHVESVEGQKGEVHGATSYQPAVVGQGLRFGNESWASVAHDSRLNGSDGLTVGLWFKIESLTDMPVLVSHGHWLQTGYFLQLIGGKLRWYVGLEGGDSVYVDAGEIGPGRWYHVVATYDGLESCVYVNGSLVGSTKKAGGIAPFNGDVHIGQYQDIGSQYQVRGVMDEVLIANGAMRGSEVRKAYLRGLSANPSLAPPTFYARTAIKPVIDGEPAKSKPLMDFSFEKDTPSWRFRDGVCQLGVVQQGAHTGQACLKVDIGDGAAPWGSCLISDQSYDVSKYPLLDFWFRTDSPESACIMANLGGDQAMEWYSLVFCGEDQYRPVGRITQFLADGKWHHVTFDLGAALEGAVGKKDLTVHHLIFGSWKTPGPFTYWFDDLRICGRDPGE
ncbi:MAG: LamG domain-containing protein, partial [Armatimonadetes bacterium]|nr:LamG domain-containing protein [Armatimonadota bacterium]